MSTLKRSASALDTADADAAQLRAIGYEPVLARRMSGFGNFAISFSIISILSGCMTLFGFGMNTGGPAVMLWGWVGVGALVLLIGLGLAEVTSAYPTSGALYFMADRLGGKRWGWITGWMNLLGLFGMIAGIDYGAAAFLGALIQLFHPSFAGDTHDTLVLCAIILLAHAGLNLFGVRVLDLFNRVSVWWHVAGVVLIVGAVVLIPSHHQSASFILTHTVNNTGFKSSFYVAGIGLLLAGYTFTGYDASAHLSEETTGAATSAPKGIVRAIYASWIAGFILIAGMLYAIQDYDKEVSAAVPPAQIFLDALGMNWTKILMLVVVVAQLCCGLAAVGGCARMVFAFSRDGALPGSVQWRKVNSQGVPTRAVWLAVCAAFVLVLPVLWNTAAYAAVTAIGTIGLTPAYVIPIFLRLRQGSRFEAGAWNLGKWSRPVGIAAIVWVIVETVLFCLPQGSPITKLNFNYAPIALVVALALSWGWWLVRGRSSYAPPTAAIEAQQFADLEVI